MTSVKVPTIDQVTRPNLLNRYAGGTNRDVDNPATPMISGYWLSLFHMPTFISDSVTREKWLSSTCKNYTPHTRTINAGAFPGMGGISKQIATSQQIGNNFTLEFTEFNNFEIISTFEKWSGFINPHMGITSTGLQSKYKGILMMFLMNGEHPYHQGIDHKEMGVRKIIIYRNVWPLTEGIESLASDIETNSLINPSIQFAFDGYPLTFNEDAALFAYTSKVLETNFDIIFSHTTFQKTYKNLTGNNHESILERGQLPTTNPEDLGKNDSPDIIDGSSILQKILDIASRGGNPELTGTGADANSSSIKKPGDLSAPYNGPTIEDGINAIKDFFK